MRNGFRRLRALSLLSLALAFAACREGDPVSPPADPDPVPGPDRSGHPPMLLLPGPRQEPASAACGSVLGSIPASDPCFRFLGRVDAADPAAVRFDWPAVVIEARFRGTSAKARLAGAGVHFDVFIDGVRLEPKPGSLGKSSLFVAAGQEEHGLATGLPAGEHTLRIEKRSETLFSAAEFRGLVLDAGAGLAPLPARSPRRIEFIGDSYTVGYGNESPSKTSPGRQDPSGRECSQDELVAHTNSQATYAVLAAKALGAEYQVNAYSGLGMVRHYNGSTAFLPFQDYYRRTLLSDAASPDYRAGDWAPQAVLIGLGTNDFSTPLGPNDASRFADRQALYQAYRDRYRDFLKDLRGKHPGAKFILMATNLWPDDEMKAQVKQVIADQKALGHQDLAYFELINLTGYGCGWHPDLATHQQTSRQLVQTLSQLLGWDPTTTSIRR